MAGKLLKRNLEQYKELKAEHTAQEIFQQPQLWQNILKILAREKQILDNFLKTHLHKHAKIIFTGAGTSEFVGNTVVPYLRNFGYQNVFSIASTDIVGSPSSYLSKEDEILLVSCARSGNSPESLATTKIVDTYAKHAAHLILCCNPQAELVEYYQSQSHALSIILEGAHDLGFAMTGSFSSMVLAAIMIFGAGEDNRQLQEYFLKVEAMIANLAEDILAVCQLKKQRIICLGSSYMKGIAIEAHLKILELSAGKHTAHFDSPLGFRHGPKSLLYDQSLILFFMNEDTYTRQYEYDLLQEMYENTGEHYIVAISPETNWEREKPKKEIYCHKLLCLPQIHAGNNYIYALAAVIVAQLFALENSIQLSIAPDNPSPTGLVNRVVQGVTIYPLPQAHI